MIEFVGFTVGPLDTNCYIIWDKHSLKGAVIDPGGNKDQILDECGTLGLDVQRVLLTHGHPDHTFCAGDIAARLGARIGMHRADVVQHEAVLAVVGLYYDVTEHVRMAPDDLFADNELIRLGDVGVTVLHTPGHSEGGLCFVTDAGVFCGDTIFSGSIGRTDFPGGSYETLIRSIKEKLLVMDDGTPLYPGHGSATSVGSERANNPFLQ